MNCGFREPLARNTGEASGAASALNQGGEQTNTGMFRSVRAW
jgi:hypothetical protein